jgi:tRNA nucleotidyltransferase (CCA-adding enzyme)
MNAILRIGGKILQQNHRLVGCHVQKCFDSTFKTCRLETPLFKKILTDELTFLWQLFERNNFKLRIAGGAVRDLLIESEPHDVDLATNALPDQMLEMFTRENIRVINLNGIKHGTVPVRINDKVNIFLEWLKLFFSNIT